MRDTRSARHSRWAEHSIAAVRASIWKTLILIAGMLAADPSITRAQAVATHRCLSDTLRLPDPPVRIERVDTIAPGVTYTCLLRPEGPWLLHIATIDLSDRTLEVDAVRADDRAVGRERVSAMATRLSARGERPLVAINADFFDLASGEIENNHVVAGQWVKGALVTDSPHDEFDNAHTQFAIDAAGRMRIDRFALDAEVRTTGASSAVVGINYRPPRTTGLVLYTPWYGSRTLRDTSQRATTARPRDPDASSVGDSVVSATRPPAPTTAPPSIAQLRADSARSASLAATRGAVEVVLSAAGRRGDTLLYRLQERTLHPGGGTSIPAQGAVLSATGDSAIAFVRSLAEGGGEIRVRAALAPSVGVPRVAVGGWPRVVRAGRNVGIAADSLEGTFPRFSAARHPRSAIALSRDSTRLLLVVVDGRRPWSVGMSLAELGDALLALGAGEAMNLDGGGSSALWVDGAIVNFPSDPTGERAVGNALVVRRRTAPPQDRR
ncbi:MAG: phosphodiester glycosidase family protein [Gemmatimonadaceae bacterium]|nr:phosphodiester glycosidase family protein [Gemmatimonadaceae bacterium]